MPMLSLKKPKTRKEKEAEHKALLDRMKASGTPKTFVDWILWLREPSCFPVDPAVHKDDGTKKARADMTWEDVQLRWPFLTAHMICESLGYATPDCAARIVLDAANGRENWCEWIYSCYKKDPRGALRMAIRTRHHHHGYMSDINQAAKLVLQAMVHGQPDGMLASWF